MSTGLTPAVKYLFQRLKEGGDRYDLVQFYDGAKVFDPNYATKITNNDANKLIEKLGIYPKIGDGDNLLQLKKSWKAYKTHAQRNISSLENDGDILSWHYAVYLGLDEEMEVDKKKNKCRYCGNENGCCKCNKNLRVWFEMACLVALVMPSSAASERVFSLLNNLFCDRQVSLLSDAIYASLYLSYNERVV